MTELMPDSEGFSNTRIMTDAVAGYWTVVFETEVDKLDKFFDMMKNPPPNPELEEIFKNYHDLVIGGRREIWKIE